MDGRDTSSSSQLLVNFKYRFDLVKNSVPTSKETQSKNVLFSEGGSLSFAAQDST